MVALSFGTAAFTVFPEMIDNATQPSRYRHLTFFGELNHHVTWPPEFD